MKKLLILPIVLGLCACDRPNASVDMLCAMDKNIQMQVYDEYVILSVNGGESFRVAKQEERVSADKVSLYFRQDGWGVNMYVRRDKKMMGVVAISVPGDSRVFACDVLTPFNAKLKYGQPTDTERCIDFIVENVYMKDENPSHGLVLWVPHLMTDEYGKVREVGQYTVEIPADDAITLSPNWDYSNMKYYRLDDGVQEHESDACDVKQRLQQYILQIAK